MGRNSAGQLLTLCVADKRFGIPPEIVREVARLPRLTRVPHAPPAMLGLANVRGAPLPVLSLARLLGRTSSGEKRIVVVDAGERVGLAVDAVTTLLDSTRAAEAEVEPIDAPALVAAAVKAQADRVLAIAGADDAVTAIADTAAIALVTFAIGRQMFALPLDAVDEVLRMPAEIAAMPHVDAAVLGSIDVRGALLPLLSLAALLALPGGAVSARSRIVVARIGEHRVGLAVDAMRAILRVVERDIDPVPLVLSRGDAEARIQAICRIGGGGLVSVLSANQLLREDITARLLQTGTSERATAVQEEASAQYLLFSVGGEAFGILAAAVEEVATLPRTLAQLPRSPDFVRGVMNLRGQAVPVIDQARRFGAASSDNRKQRVLVVRDGTLRAGLLVDSASEMRRIPASALYAAPDLGDGATRDFDRAFTDSDGRVVLIVAPHDLLDRTERDMLRAVTAP